MTQGQAKRTDLENSPEHWGNAVLTELRQIRSLLENGSKDVITSDDDKPPYTCKYCGKQYDKRPARDGHLGVCPKRDGYKSSRWSGEGETNVVSDELAAEIMGLIDNLPADRLTASMIQPYTSSDVSAALNKLYKLGAVDRQGKGWQSDPYNYGLTEEGQEWLDERQE